MEGIQSVPIHSAAHKHAQTRENVRLEPSGAWASVAGSSGSLIGLAIGAIAAVFVEQTARYAFAGKYPKYILARYRPMQSASPSISLHRRNDKSQSRLFQAKQSARGMVHLNRHLVLHFLFHNT